MVNSNYHDDDAVSGEKDAPLTLKMQLLVPSGGIVWTMLTIYR